MVAAMSKKERVRAALRGERVDRVPVALWGHDFLREWSPEDLAAQTIEAYRACDWDFIKLNPRWTFFAEAWGNRYQPPVEQRYPRLLDAVVKSPADLATIGPVDPAAGVFGEHLTALGLVLDGVGAEVDVLYTLFSPLAVLGLLCGGVGRPLVDFAAADPAAAHTALAAITTTLRAHGRLAVDRGAAGLFFAPLQWSSRRNCSEDFFREFGRPYDLQVLQGVRTAEFNVLHVCGDDNMVRLLLDYPVAALNWADRGAGNPSLAEVRPLTSLALMGGIDHQGLAAADAGAVRLQADEAMTSCPDRFLLAGGCGISPATPSATRRLVAAAARRT